MNLRRFIISSSKLRPTARKGLHAYPVAVGFGDLLWETVVVAPV
jgi:hypothetical protein